MRVKNLFNAAFFIALSLATVGSLQLAIADDADEKNKQIYQDNRAALIQGYQEAGNKLTLNYANWKAAATGPARVGVHGNRYLMTYVNDIGHATYTKYAPLNVDMPVGSVIAKESFKIRGGDKFRAGPIFFMEKVGVDKAPETDGWFYSRLKANGKPSTPRQKFCHGCHDNFASQDALGYPAEHVRIGFAATKAAAASSTQSRGDIQAGEQAFASCAGCHQVGAGAKNAFGPVLTNVLGRKAGSYSGYKYSADLKAAGKGGLVWDEQSLFKWLAGPSAFLKEHLEESGATSKMPINFSDGSLRNNIIAYLGSLSEDMEVMEKTHGDAPSPSPKGIVITEDDEIDAMPRVRQTLVQPPFLPEHTQKASGPVKIVEVELVVEEKSWTLDNKGTEIIALTYNGSIPAPMIIVHQNDYVELTLKNPASNLMEHNIDLHAATGALGGAAITTISPGEETVLRFKATKAGVFLYHCAPEGSMTPYHVTHGMTGSIMVLPRDGLKDDNGNALTYDKAYYVGENDFYVPRDSSGRFKKYSTAGEDLVDWIASMHTLTPSHIVFNGRVGALTGKGAMTAEVGDSVLFLHMQGNRDTRPHLIGGHGDFVWETGSFASPPLRDIETWFVRGGSVGAALYTFRQPGVYAYLNHNLIEAVEFGAAGHVVVKGEWDDTLMKQKYLGPIKN